MKKIILSVIVIAIITLTNSTKINAQAFEQGDINIGGGVGIGTTLGGGLPISAHAEYALTDAISVGAYAAFASYTNTSYKYNYTIIGARGSYHFSTLLNLPDELDVYGGLGLYNYSESVKSVGADGTVYRGSSLGGIHLAATAGGRYYFTDNIAVFVEASHEISYLQAGITFKF